ncbi:site-specific integrase [Dyadobacter pollutisoli]|uniref:Site-specific integrase n=1 Tax=Dyadobacter pollutisoli TaxID=2910158 RepID=A0A9E8NFK6_9BACT|nr:site-specific integrase [Dyadobacter pollutisoli]WAC13209.1 site-specific integrase [Dyadobacter pollutisoli]
MPEVIIKIHALIISANGHLRGQAFSPSTVDKYNHLWSKLAKYMAASGSEVYNRQVGQEFLTHLYGQFSYSGLTRNEKSVVRKIQYLTEFQEKGSVPVKRKSPGPYFTGSIGNLMESFIASRQESGFSTSTLTSNRLYLHILFVFLEKKGVGLAGSITPTDLVAFVESQKDTSVTTKYGMFGVIRNFLKHLHSVYPDTRDLSGIIPKVNYIRQAKLPSVYSREEIQSLLAVIDRGNPKGKRDYALMLIGARLGLRASDILGLTFANLCWDECQIVLDQKKTGRNLELPLTSEIGEAIIDYLKHGRPVSNQPYVFLCLTPPYGQLTNVTVSTITSHYLTLAGIDTSTRKHGTHILRHSLVAKLLDQKTPIHVISGTLGHSSADSTRHYVRIDTKAMEPCALQVPPVAPTFYDRVTDFFFLGKKKQETR